MKKAIFILAIAPAFLLAGCGTAANNSTSNANPSTAPTNTTSQAAPKTASYTLNVYTSKADGPSKQYPAIVPAYIKTLPENADVTVTVHNYDDGGATLVNKSDNTVQGTVSGSMTVDGKTVTSVPESDVAHTITIAAAGSFKGLNIPIQARTDKEKYDTIVFTFHTPSSPTTLKWECMAACGSGKSGMSGVMNMSTDPGYMSGTWTVQ